jgi:hypothetical protein
MSDIKFEILIDYITGDSYKTDTYYDEATGIVVSDIKLAKENLKRIKEFYIKYDNNYTEEPLKIVLDEGEKEITPFWQGYFERLISAKIVIVNDTDDMKFNTWDL